MEPIQAIFEQGVLRPLQPVHLNEDEVVSLVISRPAEVANEMSEARQAANQREVLLRFIARMESLPDNTPSDGMTNRDHDRLIYGS